MSAPAPVLLVASAFLHALWNALLKREKDPGSSVVVVLASAALLAALAAFAVPGGAAFATPGALGWGAASGLCEGVYFITLAAALSRAPYGLAYTIARGGAMLLVWPASIALLGERATLPALGGALLVALGLAAAAGFASPREPSRISPGGLGYALACAASIAGYHLCYGRALALGARPAPLFAVALGVALPFVLVNLGAARRAAVLRLVQHGAALRLSLVGALCTASFLVFLVGLAASGAGAALTLRNTSIAFAQLFALGLGERVPRSQLVGCAVLLAGATLVGAR